MESENVKLINSIDIGDVMSLYEDIRNLLRKYTNERIVTTIIDNEITDTYYVKFPLGYKSNMKIHIELFDPIHENDAQNKQLICRITSSNTLSDVTVNSFTLSNVKEENNDSLHTDYYEMKYAYFEAIIKHLSEIYPSSKKQCMITIEDNTVTN